MIIIGLVFVGSNNIAQAQGRTIVQSQAFTRYYLKLELSEAWKVRQEVENRFFWFPERQHQFATRTHLQRNINNRLQVAAGFTYFIQSLPQLSNAELDENRVELRPQVEMAYKLISNKKFVFQVRSWTEFRFFEERDDHFVYGNIRQRLRFQISYRLLERLRVTAQQETHLNIGNKTSKQVFNQNRIGASVRYDFNSSYGVEVAYINWFQPILRNDDIYNRNIVRFTFHHTIKFY